MCVNTMILIIFSKIMYLSFFKNVEICAIFPIFLQEQFIDWGRFCTMYVFLEIYIANIVKNTMNTGI